MSAPTPSNAAETSPTISGSIAALGAIIFGTMLLQVAGTILATGIPLRMALSEQPPSLIGFVASAFSFGFLLGCIGLPPFVRRFGHIRSFVVFAALLAMSTLTMALATEPWWAASRFVMGAAVAGYNICVESWVSGHASGSQRGRLFGIYQILTRIAVIGTQIAIGYVAIRSQDVFLVVSMIYSLALIPVTLTQAKAPEMDDTSSVGLRGLWQQAPTAAVSCVYTGLVASPLSNLAPAYGIFTGLDQKASIFLTASIQAGALLLQWPVGHLADRVASRLIMLVSICLVALSALLLLLLPNVGVTSHAWLYILFAVAGGCSIPMYTVGVAHAYHKMGRERAVGLSAMLLLLWGAGSAIGPLAAAVPMQVLGPRGMLGYIIVLSIGAAIYVTKRIATVPSPAIPADGVPAELLPDTKSVTR